MVVFVILNEVVIVDLVDIMVVNIVKVNIIFFVGGFLVVDELDGFVKFIVNILFNKKVCVVIDSFIEKGGFIIGICNGF